MFKNNKIILINVIFFLLIPLISATEINILPYPDSLDYRNFRGENWMTSVKSQGPCGSCWAFSSLGAFEGLINLYYNQHLNKNLSEQHLVSDCCIECGDCSGGWPIIAFEYIKNTGVPDEDCFVYNASNSACTPCDDWSDRTWKIYNSSSLDYLNNNKGFVEVMDYLYNKGPMSGIYWEWVHAMTVVGYGIDNGESYFIYKNSWGEDWGENGYGNIFFDYLAMEFDYLISPVYSPQNEYYTINCVDFDSDSFCYWGISDVKPLNCPLSCSGNDRSDIDDFDPSIVSLYDLWVSRISYENILLVNEPSNIEFDISFVNEIGGTIGPSLNFYVNNELIDTEVVPSISDGDNFTFMPSWIPNIPGYYNFKLEIVPVNGEYFLLDNNYTGSIWVYNYPNGFEITEDNYIFDCATNQNPIGQPISKIVGITYGSGIMINNADNVTIRNCIIQNYFQGILTSSNSINNSFINNTLSFNYRGISPSSNNEILFNIVTNNSEYGIYIDSGNNNIIKENIISYNSYESYYGGINIVGDSAFNNITNNVLNNNEIGIRIIYGSNNLIKDNILNNNSKGIYTYLSSNDFIGNVINYNSYVGIYLFESSYNDIINNTLDNNEGYGGFLLKYGSTNNLIENNKVSNSSTTSGIHLMYSSSNNILVSNIINNNFYGISFYNSSNNTISNNNLHNIYRNAFFDSSSGNNKIYHNNFFSNSDLQVYDASISNMWDYNNEGNYFNTYDTIEEGCYDNDYDGFCDDPYIFDYAQDNYPFVNENGWEIIQPPQYTLIASPLQGVAPLNVSFNLSGSFSPIALIEWHFGDNTILNSLTNINYVFENEGSYNVYAIIRNNPAAPPNVYEISNNLTIIVLPKSKIQNTGSNLIQGYLLMKIQKNNNGVWQDYSIIINDLQTSTLRTINGNSYLALDEIWNVNNVMINQIGNYRVYAALLNINGNVIQTLQGSLEDTYEFVVTSTIGPVIEEELT